MPAFYRWLDRGGLIALVLALLLFSPAPPSGGEATAATQPPPLPENSLVQAPDGTLYVVEGGYLHLIRPLLASDAQIAAMPIGDPVTTGVAIIPTAGPVNPCGEASEVRVCVLSVQRPFQGAFPARSGMEFALIRLRIENLRSEQLLIGGYESNLRVRDINGSVRDWGSGGNTPPPPEPLGSGFIPPGAAQEGNVIISLSVGVPLTHVIWVLRSSPYEAVEAPIP